MISLNKFLFWKKTPIIEFMCHPEHEGIVTEPKPAGNYIPDWFKRLNHTIDPQYAAPDHFGNEMATAKKCKPVIDAYNYGFTFTVASDVRIISNEDCTEIQAINPVHQLPVVEFHNAHQLGGFNAAKKNQGNAIKFINYWIIKTAPGWSTLFIPPVNNFELPFTCFSGIVDTDCYNNQINFPAVWNVPNFNGFIKVGTPIVTVIPIRRKTFKQKSNFRVMNEDEMIKHDRFKKILQTRSSYYAEYVREKK